MTRGHTVWWLSICLALQLGLLTAATLQADAACDGLCRERWITYRRGATTTSYAFKYSTGDYCVTTNGSCKILATDTNTDKPCATPTGYGSQQKRMTVSAWNTCTLPANVTAYSEGYFDANRPQPQTPVWDVWTGDVLTCDHQNPTPGFPTGS